MKKAIVAGTGISGINSARLLLEKGFEVTLFDENRGRDAAEILKKTGGNARVVLGSLSEEDKDGALFCVMSPGINPRTAFAEDLRKKGIKCISEIELAFEYEKGRVAAITGTNGKTTTTALLGEICKSAGKQTIVAGNIGKAYTSEVTKSSPESISVLEVAGFHLETTEKFRPDVCAVLNITPDHLDRFGTMETYAAAKLRITENQSATDVCVLNYEDERLREFAPGIKAKVLFFSSKRELPCGAFLRGNRIILRSGEGEIDFIGTDEMTLLGEHNYENVMAAVLMALSLGLDIDAVRRAVKTFKAVPHRIEFVREIDGVAYYNDSKGTNPDAAIKAILAMVRPTVLIAGGYDKHVGFDEWINACKGRVRKIIVIGESADQIEETAKRHGLNCLARADSFEEAVEAAKKAALPGDAVLLSPACASWDMFDNYEQRGDYFKELIGKNNG